jgi:hypothetical protein
MPEIPFFLPRQNVQIGSPSPRMDIGGAGVVGAALQRAGNEVAAPAEEFLQRYAAAKRQADAANLVAGASKQLDDAQFRWSKVADNIAARDGFGQEAAKIRAQALNGIDNPEVSSYVAQRLDEQITARSSETRRAAFTLESSAQRGALDARLNQYAQSAAMTRNPLLLQQFTDQAMDDIKGAVGGGWLHPEEGVQKSLAFRGEVQRVLAEQDRNAALASRDPQAARAWANKINDPTSYPGLLPAQREALAQRAETITYRLSVEEATRQARADALAARELTRVQQSNETKLLVQTWQGKPPDLATLQEMADHQQISAGGAAAIHNAMINTEEGHDDPAVANGLYARLRTDLTNQDVFDARGANKLSKTTSDTLLRAIGTRDEQRDNQVERAAFNELKTALNGHAIEQGILTMDPQTRYDQAALWAEAQGEWTKRVTIGRESPQAVLADMLPRYRHVDLSPNAWPQPRVGAIKNLDDVLPVAQKTKAAFDAGQLTPAQYQDEKALIIRIKQYYENQQLLLQSNLKASGGARAKFLGYTPSNE